MAADPRTLRIDDEKAVAGGRQNRRHACEDAREEGAGKVRDQRDDPHDPLFS